MLTAFNRRCWLY